MNRIAVYGYPGKVWFDGFAEIVANLTAYHLAEITALLLADNNSARK